MKNKVYIKLGGIFLFTIVGLFACALLLKNYTNMYDEKQEEIGKAIEQQAQDVPEAQKTIIISEYEKNAAELRAKEQFVRMLYLVGFVIFITTFLVFMLKRAITD